MTMEKLMKMSIDDVLSVKDLLLIAQEAKATAELIQKTFKNSFGITLDRVQVWCDREGKNYEYLTADWIWQAQYANWSYDFKCDAQGIFELFKAEHLINWELIPYSDKRYYKFCQMTQACKYFRRFVNSLKA